MIDHGALTDLILIHLSQAELIGDGVAPPEGGWLQGQPNVAAFRPYAVLVDGGMQPVQSPQLMRGSLTDWKASWSIRYFGGSRKQCDWVAGEFRPALDSLRNMEFGSDPHRIIAADPLIIGAVMRNDQVDPPYWQANDNLTLHITPRSAKGGA